MITNNPGYKFNKKFYNVNIVSNNILVTILNFAKMLNVKFNFIFLYFNL
jgi:hypothetical protein